MVRISRSLLLRPAASLALAAVLLLSGAVMAQDKEQQAKEAYNKGIEAMQAGDAQTAITQFQAAINFDPDYYDALVNLGAVYYGMGNYEDALSTYKKAVDVDEQGADAWANMGRIQLRLKRYAEAEASLKKALELEPTNGELYSELGKVHYLKRNYGEVINTLARAHDNDAGNALTYYMMGKSLQKQDKDQEAIQALTQSVKLGDNNYNAHFALGQIYLGQGKYLKAAEHFKAAEKERPNSAYKAAYNYAVAMESHDQDAIDTNIANWQRFIRMAKGNPKAKSDVAVAEQHVKDLKEKKEHMELN